MSTNRYFVLLNQNGGCDYTIGCGLVFKEIKGASYLAEAWKLLPDILDYYGLDNIDKATVFEVTGEQSFDIDSLVAERERLAEQEAMARKEEDERAQFERLALKFGAKK